MEQHSIHVSDNQLVCSSLSGQPNVKTFETKISKAQKARCGIVVLLDPGGGDPRRSFHNLLLLDWALTVVWRAELPNSTGANAYVNVKVSDDIIQAWTWDGWRCTIDETNGRIKSCEFVK